MNNSPLVWMTQAGWAVQMVLLVLIAASVIAWAVIIQKTWIFRQANSDANRFEKLFWEGGDLLTLYRQQNQSGNHDGMASLFLGAYREFAWQNRQETVSPEAMLQNAQRAMEVAFSRRMETLESQLALLATVGSVSPFIGLFGTVWGIMHSFSALGLADNVSLGMVAPGISEALIATAAGLVAAIPASAAYNHFTDMLGRLQGRYDAFCGECLNILYRNACAKEQQKKSKGTDRSQWG